MPSEQLKSGSIAVGNGAEIYYEERGSGPVLLCIHGLWGSCRFFHPQLEFLSARYRVIAIDLRGHGRSSMTIANQTVSNYARDLDAFIKKLGLTAFVTVGWSMGAYVMWDHYLQFGVSGCRGLIVIDQPPSDWRSPQIPAALLSMESLREWHYRVQTDRNNFMREVIPMMFAKAPKDEDFRWMYDEMTRAPEAIAAAILVDQSLREYQDALWGYPIPTLVCGGGHSVQPRAGLELIVERVKNGRLVVFKDSGHCLFLEESKLFNTEVDQFAWPLLA